MIIRQGRLLWRKGKTLIRQAYSGKPACRSFMTIFSIADRVIPEIPWIESGNAFPW
jgi:hypothetical protein